MKTKQIIWLVVAVAVFAVTGFLGVQSAITANQQAANMTEELGALFGSEFESFFYNSGEVSFEFPEEEFIARVDVVGTIMETDPSTAALSGVSYNHGFTLDYIDALMECESNQAMMLYINSPGGTINDADELYLKLMEYKEKTGRTIYAYFDDYACSGGYYVAMAADFIYANRNSLCVNIGVYMSTYNFSELFEKAGVEQVVFRSSPNKGIGMAGVEWTEEQKAIYQSIVDVHYAQFLDVVAKGRGMDYDTLAATNDGREMVAPQALEAGFIDGISPYEEFEALLMQLKFCDCVYTAAPPASPFDSLFGYISSVLPKSEAQVWNEFAGEHDGIVVMAYADSFS